MAKHLVIVESPTKAKTLERYLGEGYRVAASKGHVRDLPADRMGVEPEHDFAPEYQVKPDSADTVEQLRKAFKGAEGLWLATDFDREGEAIAWHVAESIGADPRDGEPRDVHRDHARRGPARRSAQPRTIDFDLVNAQQARRILDRLVGYELSPLLQKGPEALDLSAGRVQSVALRLIVDREREIEAFVARSTGASTPDWPRTGTTGVPCPADPGRRREARGVAGQEGPGASTQEEAEATSRGCASGVPRRRGAPEGGQAHAGAAVHHLDAAAGGRAQARVLGAQRRCSWRSACTRASTSRRGAGRPHHLHANRLGEHRRAGARARSPTW